MMSLFWPKVSVPGNVQSGLESPMFCKESPRTFFGDSKTLLAALLPLVD
jgi:hypothetical protein